MGLCDESELGLVVTGFTEPVFLSSLLNGSRFFLKFSSDTAWLAILEIPWPHWFFDRKGCIELTLSRRNNKNSSQSFICRILMTAHSVKIMAEIQRRIRFNTISMSVLMITIAVGVMTAMWMYADSVV